MFGGNLFILTDDLSQNNIYPATVRTSSPTITSSVRLRKPVYNFQVGKPVFLTCDPTRPAVPRATFTS
jgi:hypothetical protein